MATTIKLKNSVTTTAAPTTLAQGEVATNVTDKKIWVGNAASSPVQLLGAGASASLTSLTTSSDSSISGLTVGKGGGAVSSNTAIGLSALLASASGGGNVAVGKEALTANTSGSVNTAVGSNALIANTSGASNTAFGAQALLSNTTASNNTAVGYQALYTKTTGDFNVALGYQAGLNMTTGQRNTVIGTTAGSSLTTGSNNTFVGCLDTTGGLAAGAAITTGSKNSILGNYTGNNGGLDIRTASNYIVLSDGDGNPRLLTDPNGWLKCLGVYNLTTASAANVFTDSGGFIYRSTSALKYKQDIRDLESIDINKFRPIRYKSKCANDDQTKDHFGIIADEVAEAGITELVNYGAEGEVEGFQYERLTVVLLKAVQELKAEVDSLKQQLGK